MWISVKVSTRKEKNQLYLCKNLAFLYFFPHSWNAKKYRSKVKGLIRHTEAFADYSNSDLAESIYNRFFGKNPEGTTEFTTGFP